MTEAQKSQVVDYGWEGGEAEPSHDYLQPVVMNVLKDLAPRGNGTYLTRSQVG